MGDGDVGVGGGDGLVACGGVVVVDAGAEVALVTGIGAGEAGERDLVDAVDADDQRVVGECGNLA